MNSQSTMNETSSDRTNDLKVFDEAKIGVKGVVDAGIEKVPSIFIRPLEDRLKDLETCPENNISLPVIDFAHVGESKDRDSEIVNEVLLASKEWGFFQVLNHGIPFELLENMIDGARMFHEQENEVKKKLYSQDFFSKRVTFLSNHDLYKSKAATWRDTLYVNTMVGELDPQEVPPICKDVILEYINHILKFGDRILMLLSVGLGLKPEYLGELLESSKGWSYGCHYYPACPEPQLTLGTPGHTDTDFLTILLQDQIGALQVLHKNEWVNVEPLNGALIVNIGDALQIISNDILKSVYHRVITKSVGPRISTTFFFHGSFLSKKVYGPIKELTSEVNPPIYKEFTIEELLTYFFSRSIEDLGIDYFKLSYPKDDI